MASGFPDYPRNPPISRTGDRTAIAHREWLEDEVSRYHRLACFMLNHMFGQGRDGVYQMGPNPGDSLFVEPTSPASMKVIVNPGVASEDGDLGFLESSWTSNTITAPVSNDRIDVVQFNVLTWTPSIVTGSEASAPTAPSVDDNCVKLAEIDLTPTTTSITAATGGELTDERTFTNA